MKLGKSSAALATAAACALIAPGAGASVLTFGYSVEYAGGTPPVGAAPWVVATFDDNGSAGAVRLTVTSRLADGEFLDRILFNLDPALDPAALSIRPESATGTFSAAYVLTGKDDLQAAGNSLFDVKLMFETGPGPGRFDGADSATYTITGIPTLTADSFAFRSVGGSISDLLTATHVLGMTPGIQIQTVTPTPGGWVTVPEPTSAVLGLCAAVLLCRRRRDVAPR